MPRLSSACFFCAHGFNNGRKTALLLVGAFAGRAGVVVASASWHVFGASSQPTEFILKHDVGTSTPIPTPFLNAFHRPGRRMVSLGKVTAPKPINLPSQK